jgi:uncharacterized protein (TIGR02118 family)
MSADTMSADTMGNGPTRCKAIILLSRREDMTAEAFRRWWLEEHAPLARQLPGLRRLVFNVVEGDGPFDGVSELWFDSREDFDAAYASELGKRVAADSMAHVRGRERLFVEERPQFEG